MDNQKDSGFEPVKNKPGRPPKSPEERKTAREHTEAVRLERARANYSSMSENKYGHILYCGICGAHMGYFRTNLCGANPYVMYQCKNHKVWKYREKACPRANIRLELLDTLVLAEIQKEKALARYLLNEMSESENSLYMRIQKQLQKETDYAWLRVQEDHIDQFSAFYKWQVSEITEDEYAFQRGECLKSEREHMNLWTKTRLNLVGLRAIFNENNSWMKAMESLPDDNLPSKEILQKQIYRIDLYEDNHIEITWRRNLTRERLFLYLDTIGAVPDGMYNPPHRGCRNPGLFVLSREELVPNQQTDGGGSSHNEL